MLVSTLSRWTDVMENNPELLGGLVVARRRDGFCRYDPRLGPPKKGFGCIVNQCHLGNGEGKIGREMPTPSCDLKALLFNAHLCAVVPNYYGTVTLRRWAP